MVMKGINPWQCLPSFSSLPLREYYNANIRGGALIVKKVQKCMELRNFGPQEIIQQKNSIHDIVCRIRGWNYSPQTFGPF